jgi:hypothetical protein
MTDICSRSIGDHPAAHLKGLRRCGLLIRRQSRRHHEGLLRIRAALHFFVVLLETFDTCALLQCCRTAHSPYVCHELWRLHLRMELGITCRSCLPVQLPTALGDDDITMFQYGEWWIALAIFNCC